MVAAKEVDRQQESPTTAKADAMPAPDITANRSLLEEYAREEDLFILYPAAQAEKKDEDKSQEKKDAPENVTAKAEEPPTTLQDAPGPKADDHLLDLWQKDLDQAMQQPPGRRKIQFSIPVVENDRVLYFVNFFCHKKRDFFERSLARSGKYIPMMATILQEEGLPEDLVYLSLIESGFSTQAVSKAKAVGPWQFIRSTGLRYGLKIDGWVDERRDPLKSTRAAAAYLKDLHEQFGQWFLAAAAYNAGERKVEKAMNRANADNFWDISGKRSYLKQETRNYVPKFIAATVIASAPEKFGFEDVVYQSPVEYDEVTLETSLRLETVAQLAGTTVKTIKELNPALLRNITPPGENGNGYVVRLPSGRSELFTQSYQQLPESAKVKVITHKVKKGETLAGIAKRYGHQTTDLMEINSLKTRRVQPGQELTVISNGVIKTR
jgi:membrane-bound lytic murein transglycosylase D